MQNVTIDRDKYIGGSDIPTIMGISPFKTRFELLQEKAGLIQNKFKGNEYTQYGNVMEPKIREFVNSSEKDKFVEGKDIVGDIRCHTDGINKTTVLEIKTTSQLHNTVDEYKTYLVQLLFYMKYTKRKKGKLAVYARPSDFDEEFNNQVLQVFDIKLSDYKELINEIDAAVDSFRIDLSKLKENPFLTEEDLVPVDLTELSNKLIVLEERLASYKKLEKEEKELKAQLKTAMENNRIKKWETPSGIKITLVPDSPEKTTIEKVLNETLFRQENTELVEQYELKQAEYLEDKEVTKKGKTGYVKITIPKEA